MRDKIGSHWFDVRESLWLLPSLITIAAVVIASITIRIDQGARYDQQFASTWAFGGGAEGARGVLTAIAGTMMTVTALVFSIMVVAFQLAVSQLTPRVLRSVMADRGNQVVLGVFVATFTYALVVLRAVRSAFEDQGEFVPALSVSIAIGLALLSVALLIYFMHHSTHILRASVVIVRVADGVRGLMAVRPVSAAGPESAPAPAFPGAPRVVTARHAGYLQAIGMETLLETAEREALTIEVVPRVGDFVLPGQPIARVWRAEPVPDGTANTIHDAFDLGHERTMQQDIGFGIQQLSDIAVRALSPAVNDPTTATVVGDNLAALFVELGNRAWPHGWHTAADGAVRLIVPGPSYDELVSVAFAQIAHYGRGDPVFRERLAATLERMAPLVPDERRHPLLRMEFAVRTGQSAPATATLRIQDASDPRQVGDSDDAPAGGMP